MDPLGESPPAETHSHDDPFVALGRQPASTHEAVALGDHDAPRARTAYDFGGMLTALVIGHLKKEAPSTLSAILQAAGESRSPDELEDVAAWSSYSQVRRLFEATAAALGGPAVLREIGEAGHEQWGLAPEIREATRSLGSPAAMLRSPDLASAVFPIVETVADEIAPDEWCIKVRFLPGYEPFPELCAFRVGLYSLIPRAFGFHETEAAEETCQCHGAEWCRIRLSWGSEVDPKIKAAEERKGFEGRLLSLQRTVTELVSGEGLDTVLPKLVHAAGRAVLAPVHVLSIDLDPGHEPMLFWRGTDEDTARHYVVGLGDDRASGRPHVLVNEIHSARARYGRLMAFRHAGEAFNTGEQAMLETYASLAAAALDSAMALDEARREAMVNKTLFKLSAFVVELGTVDEVAQRLADAIPKVIGSDRATVVIRPHAGEPPSSVALSGYPPDVEPAVRDMIKRSPGQFRADGDRSMLWHDPADPDSPFGAAASAIGSALGVSLPLYLGDQLVGSISTNVTVRPSRLRTLPDLAERLQGLAGYAAVALANTQLHEALRHQSLHDSLTGLPNRTLILDRIEQMLTRDRRHHTGVGLFFVDLDFFKQVNDTFGHQGGDEILRAVATRFLAAVRESDTVGRLGGDEFVVLVDGASLASGHEVVAQRLLDSLQEPFVLRVGERVHTVTVSASIGIALGQRLDANVLLGDGDIALYSAKAAGRHRFIVFEPQMQSALRNHYALEAELRQALKAGQFFLVYQPIYQLSSMTMIGVEALLRWRHPERGVLGPAEFVPILEESRLISEVGRWVLVEACGQARSWHDAGLPLSVSVNVSGRTLQEGRLVDDVRQALEGSGLQPGSLVVEITETSLMADTDEAIAQINRLRHLGVRVAIDDFGTGYSSLSYLSRFAVDVIKIDRSFVAGMTSSPSDEALVHMIVHLANLLGLGTVAEGIHEVEQLAMLTAIGCESGQGFLLARPMPADEVGWCFENPGLSDPERTPT